MRIHSLHRVYGLFFLLAGVSLLWAFGMPTLRVSSQGVGFSDQAGGLEEQIEVTLHAESAPAPGGVANFTFAIKPLRHAPDLTVTWHLPDGGELIGGPAVEILGAVEAGATVTQTRQIRFPVAGVYTVRAQATYRPDRATTLNAVGVLFFTINTAGSTASDGDPRLVPYRPPAFKPTVDKSGRVVAANTWGPDAPQGCFTVHGFLSREDRRPAANPPRYVDATGSAVPVHHILVEMREEDTFSDDSYGHTVTDANGRFQFNFCDDDGFLNDELELYFRVCSEVWDGHQIARIKQTSEDELYCFDSGTKDSEGGDVDFDITVWKLDTIEAAIFNIGDSLFWATKYWNDNLGQGAPKMDRSVNLNWERGRKVKSSSFNRPSTTISLADDASEPDEWDDTVIIHEWGHFADQQYSCNGSPAGAHSITGVNAGPGGDRLAWGEGYGDYLQSAVRTIIPSAGDLSFYIDVTGTTIDLEVVPNASALSEGGIAALLWDFIDTGADGSDSVNHGHARILKVFTDPAFQGNTQCNMTRFLKVWKDLGFPTDAATAATVVQNVNIATPFPAASVAAAQSDPGLSPVSLANIAAINAASPFDYRWWDQVTMVVDNSTSMAQPPGTTKLDAVKALIREQVSDLSSNPRGTEFNIYSFNDASYDPNVVQEGRFFAAQINPALDGLQANGADVDCPVTGLYAMSQAIQNKYDGQAWLYTDGDAQPYTSVDYIQQQLNNRLIHGSVVLLGGCSSPPLAKQSDISGNEKNYLGLAANASQSAGIVPYLLTAIGTGGSFLYVAPDQLANAVDILRAQASHSAGAGRWSDYVSDRHTYRWDRLLSWEYNWITPVNYEGQAVTNKALNIATSTINVYGWAYNAVHVYGDGTVGMGTEPTNYLPPISDYLDVLDRPGMTWYYQAVDNPGYRQAIFGDEVGEWVVITTQGLAEDQQQRSYQVLINKNTGEIRYQYGAVPPDDAANAEIGLWEYNEYEFGTEEVVVSNNNASGALPGMGYKFTPAPPQPSKSYTVAVDSLMSGVGFLLTGYSGVLNPMAIVDPSGTPVDCGDTANVLCVSLNGGLVQYVQVNVNGSGGNYVATVSGKGTFSFNAMAASAIQAKGLGQRTLPFGQQLFKMDLGAAVDGGVLNGWLQTATSARFGNAFSLFDDGAHEDGAAGDGLFGSDGFSPPGQGVAYLWVQGTIDGESITRSDPTPFNFQPIIVQPEPAQLQATFGSAVVVGFSVTNQDAIPHCYSWEVEVPAGFTFEGSSGSPFCVPAGETAHPYATFSYAMNNQPGGITADMNATFFEAEEGRIVGGATARVTYLRPLAGVVFDNRWDGFTLRPNSTDTVTMSVNLLDDQGEISGWSGLLGYTLNSTLGTAVAPTGAYVDGRMPIAFTSGGETGTAVITFVLEGGSTTTTTLEIREPLAKEIDLVATPTDLRGEDKTTAGLVATVRDAWGDPVVGQNVRLSISDDDGREVNGTINGSSVFMAKTDAKGQVSATFTKGEDVTFVATVRAESLVPEGAGFRATHEDSEILLFSGSPPSTSGIYMYIPWAGTE